VKRYFAAFFAAILTLGLSAAVQAEPQMWQQYAPLPMAQPVETGKKIEVREFFYYGCPHCYDVEPAVHEWLKHKPKDAEFIRTPGIFQDSWLPMTKTFYALEALGLTDKLHAKLFDAIHKQNQRNLLSDENAIFDWMAAQGVDRDKFVAAYRAFSTQAKAQQAREMTGEYGINGVPSFVVDGKYITSAAMNGSFRGLFATIDYLVEKARKERVGKK
jgi:thiol:disulfide interchange protein DsbA